MCLFVSTRCLSHVNELVMTPKASGFPRRRKLLRKTDVASTGIPRLCKGIIAKASRQTPTVNLQPSIPIKSTTAALTARFFSRQQNDFQAYQGCYQLFHVGNSVCFRLSTRGRAHWGYIRITFLDSAGTPTTHQSWMSSRKESWAAVELGSGQHKVVGNMKVQFESFGRQHWASLTISGDTEGVDDCQHKQELLEVEQACLEVLNSDSK